MGALWEARFLPSGCPATGRAGRTRQQGVTAGPPPARTTTLPRAAPLLFARPRPAPRPVRPGFPERPGSLQVPQPPARKGGLPDVKAPRDSKGRPPCSAETRFLRGDLSKGVLINFCFSFQSMECGWSLWARFINVKTLTCQKCQLEGLKTRIQGRPDLVVGVRSFISW